VVTEQRQHPDPVYPTAAAEHVKECRRLHGMAVQVSMALLLYLVGLTIYAARRRTELRERFNIAGAPQDIYNDASMR